MTGDQPIKVSVFGLNDFALLFSLFVFAGCNDLTPVHPTTVILCLSSQFVFYNFAQEYIRSELLIRPQRGRKKELKYQDGSNDHQTGLRDWHSSSHALHELPRLGWPKERERDSTG